jgi:phosphoglycolate phosphatase
LVNIRINNDELKDVQLMIFDKDGTLIDLYNYWSNMINYRVELISKELNLDNNHQKNLKYNMGVDVDNNRLRPDGPVGVKRRELVTQAAVDYLSSIGYEDQSELCIEVFRRVDSFSLQKFDEIIKPIDGCYDLFRSLKEKNCKIAIATTDRKVRAELAMQFIKLIDYIDIIAGADLVKNTKPAPDIVNYICSNLGISETNAVIIGDAVSDIQTGINANLKASIGVCTGITSKEKLLEITPYVIDGISDIKVV